MSKVITIPAAMAVLLVAAPATADHREPEQVAMIRDAQDVPVAVAVNPLTNRLYVAHERSRALKVIDASTNTVIEAVELGADGAVGIALDLATQRVFVSHADGVLSITDGVQNELVAVTPVGREPRGPVVNPATGLAYVASYREASVTVVDPSGTIVANVPVGDFPVPVAVDPVNNRIYVGDIRETLTIIDGETHEVLETLSLGDRISAIAVDVKTERIYFALPRCGCLAVVDGRTLEPEGTIPLEASPRRLAVNPDSGLLYVSSPLDASAVSIVDGPGASLLAAVLVEGSTGWIAVNPITETVYVVTASRNLSVIDGRLQSLTATLRIGNSPAALRPIAMNALTDLVYLADPRRGVYVVSGHHPVVNLVNPPTNDVTYLGMDTEIPITWLLATLSSP